MSLLQAMSGLNEGGVSVVHGAWGEQATVCLNSRRCTRFCLGICICLKYLLPRKSINEEGEKNRAMYTGTLDSCAQGSPPNGGALGDPGELGVSAGRAERGASLGLVHVVYA